MYIKTFAAQKLLDKLSSADRVSVTAQTLEGDMYTHVITVVYE